MDESLVFASRCFGFFPTPRNRVHYTLAFLLLFTAAGRLRRRGLVRRLRNIFIFGRLNEARRDCQWGHDEWWSRVHAVAHDGTGTKAFRSMNQLLLMTAGLAVLAVLSGLFSVYVMDAWGAPGPAHPRNLSRVTSILSLTATSKATILVRSLAVTPVIAPRTACARR
jgi:hypothetical protein